MTDLYDELGVAHDATPEDIKKAYRRKSREHHPDRGGDTAKMSKVNVAYAVLSDPTRRSRYDQTGDESNGLSSVEAKAKNLIYAVMSDALNNISPGRAPIIDQIRQHLKAECGKMKQHMTRGEAALKKLEDHRARLHDGGLFKNLFEAKSAERMCVRRVKPQSVRGARHDCFSKNMAWVEGAFLAHHSSLPSRSFCSSGRPVGLWPWNRKVLLQVYGGHALAQRRC